MRLAFSLLFVLHLSACGSDDAKYHEPLAGSGCVTRAIKNEFLVKFKDSRSIQRIEYPESRLSDLLKNRDIAWIEPNYAVPEVEAEPPIFPAILSNPNALVIGADFAWRQGFRGNGVTIAVVDSGVDVKHPSLRNAVRAGWNFIDNSAEVADETGHGTHIAGIIAARRSPYHRFSGIAPQAQLVAADFMNADRGDEYHALRAIEWSLQQGAKIINNSWSNFCSNSIRTSFSEWRSLNVIFVNAAGNDGRQIDNLPIFPANLNLANTITVGSANSRGTRSPFSNYGHNVFIFAPGEEVYSLATREWGIGSLISRSGTSMSTAYVSGALALVWSAYPSLSAARIVSELKGRAHAADESDQPMINVRALMETLSQSL